jgi:hypothetical protein
MRPTISKPAIERARRFVEATARPLDAAYLDYALPRGPTHDARARVLGELAHFQTPEGGFGHAIESDVRTPAPSAIATSVAFQHLRGIDAPADTPLVKAGIEYLAKTVDRQSWVWPAVDERVSEGPHAPWWAPGLDRFRGYVLNPTAELLGYLYDYRAPDDLIEGVTARVLDAVASIDVIDSAYELYCCMRLVRTKALPAQIRDVLEQQLSRSLKAADPDDPHLDLMRLVPTPASFGYEILRSGIERQAARLISSQAEDGGWRPHWEPWHAEAHREWSGEITCRAIIGLSAHGFVAD